MKGELGPYPEYKESGQDWIGRVPGHWEIRRIKYLLWEIDVRSESGDEQLLRVSQYTGVSIRERNVLSDEQDTRANSLKGYKLVKPDDLVINIMLAWNGSMGISHYNGIASPAYCVYRFMPSKNPLYFHYLFRSPMFLARIKAVSTGVVESRLRLYSDSFYGMEAILPPASEQATIVKYLSYATTRIDATIKAKRKIIALLNEQKQAIIQRAVTKGLDPNVKMKDSGVPWIGEIPEHWRITRLGRISKISNGSTPSRAIPDYWANGVIPWLASGKVNDYQILYPSEMISTTAKLCCHLSLIPKGAIVIGLIGQGKTRGMCAMLCIDACINQNLAGIVPNSLLNNWYLFYSLKAAYLSIREFGRGGNQAALNNEIIGRLSLSVPPINEQESIRKNIDLLLKDFSPREEAIQNEISLLREYRTRLVADVVTGKLDVRAAAAELPDTVGEEVSDEVDEAGEVVDDEIGEEVVG